MAVTENHEAVDEEMRQKTSNDRVVIRTSHVSFLRFSYSGIAQSVRAGDC